METGGNDWPHKDRKVSDFSEQPDGDNNSLVVDFSPPTQLLHAGLMLDLDLAVEEGFSQYLTRFTYYDLLQVKADASSVLLRTHYLRKMRQLLKADSPERKLDPELFQELVLTINVAHQVLQDPVTRASYDHSINSDAQMDNDAARNSASSPAIDIIELIRMFKILGPKTQELLQKVRDENADCSQRELAGVLVENSYLTEEELESVVLACYLLAVGKLKLTQLELVMDEIKETRAPLWVSLVAKGWVKMKDLI